MKIEKISINGIGGIKQLDIPFHDGLNLICGTNGVGKTTILECVAHGFTHQISTDILKKNANSTTGHCKICFCDTQKQEIHYDINIYDPNDGGDRIYGRVDLSKNLLFFKAQRDIKYQKLQGIARDTEKDESATSSDAYVGVIWSDIKNWFVQRFMWSAHDDALTDEQKYNLDIAKKCFNALDDCVKFSKVIPSTLDIALETASGDVFFEYLSSGYKSCVYILLGIIKEIEFRFKNPYIKISDFEGVILIDEIDVHLHPQWQAVFVDVLKNLLPKAQIIATTHSPSMIQCALPNEIIPLALDKNNNIYIKNLNTSEYGFQGWTIEEILKYVMELPSINSKFYEKTLKSFDESMNKDDTENIIKNYKILKEMLHPNNPMRKMLDIQVAGLEIG